MNDLIEAYLGFYEDEFETKYRNEYNAYVLKECDGGQFAVLSWNGWVRNRAIERIYADSPRDRLSVYLEWNGIIGYTFRIFEIATGETCP